MAKFKWERDDNVIASWSLGQGATLPETKVLCCEHLGEGTDALFIALELPTCYWVVVYRGGDSLHITSYGK